MNRFDPELNEWRSFTTDNGLPGNVVCGILEDESGNLWLSTNKGLTRFDPEAEEFTNYRVHDGIQGYLFNPGACAQTPDGEMFFGGSSGLNAFRPASVQKNSFIPPFWQTMWFTGIVVVFLASGALTVVQMWRKLKAASAVAGPRHRRASPVRRPEKSSCSCNQDNCLETSPPF